MQKTIVKTLALMMCFIAIAFTSCKPDPQPEPEPTPANAIFLGTYEGSIYLNGTATAPELIAMGIASLPIDSMEFVLRADISAGSNDQSVDVVFSISDENYETTGTVNDMQVNFGTLSYTYVENSTTFKVDLDLTGLLGNTKNQLTLTGPFTGTGIVTMDNYPVALTLTTSGTVSGTLIKE